MKNVKCSAEEVSASHQNGLNSLSSVGFILKERNTKAYSWRIVTKSMGRVGKG